MSQIFETIMLLCFGASWPLALVKNYKAGSAKGMSLPFLLLITAGYLFGIAAKIASGNITYVMWVYVLNLIIVDLNLVVYFINLRKDKTAESIKEKSDYMLRKSA